MKNLLIFFSLLIAYIANGQEASSCIVPNLLMQEYNRDIKQLATKRLFQIQSPDTFLVNIPQIHIDSIEEGMAAILNTTSFPEKDSVFNLYCVHNTNGWPFFYGGFLVKVDTTYAWTQAWQNLSSLTGNTYIDDMMTKYRLSVSDFNNWSIGNYAILTVDSSWNLLALIDSLNTIDGVLSVEPNGIVGGSGIIAYDIIGNDRYYHFTAEWQDCFDGCDAQKTWSFKVKPDCTVTYLGFEDYCALAQFGVVCDLMPSPAYCNTFLTNSIAIIQNDKLSIYPNPFKSLTHVYSALSLQKAKLTITNYLGQKVKEMQNISGNEININLENHPKGWYFIKIEQDNKLLYFNKLLKTD
jgi:hypothetical protein